MSYQTPAGEKMNKVFDELRTVLGKMNAEKGELLRNEITLVLVAMKVEAQKWQGVKKGSELPIYREGAIWEAVGMEGEEIKRCVEAYIGNWSQALT